jgi:Domain of unknown function (DUF4234)
MTGRAGKTRNVFLVWLVWPLITLGIYGLVWWYKINREARDFDSSIEVNPVLSLLAVMIGWVIIVPPYVSIYRTGNRIARMQARAGLEPTCNAWIGLILSFFFGLFSLYYQTELNKVWAHYGNPVEGTQVPVLAGVPGIPAGAAAGAAVPGAAVPGAQPQAYGAPADSGPPPASGTAAPPTSAPSTGSTEPGSTAAGHQPAGEDAQNLDKRSPTSDGTTQVSGGTTRSPDGNAQSPDGSTQTPEGSTHSRERSTQASDENAQGSDGSAQAPGGGTQAPGTGTA